VVAQLGRVPEVGAKVTWKGLELEVLLADERRVERVRITRREIPVIGESEEPSEPSA